MRTDSRRKPQGGRLPSDWAHMLEFMRVRHLDGTWVDLEDIWSGSTVNGSRALAFLELLKKANFAEEERAKVHTPRAERDGESTRPHWRLSATGYQYATDQTTRAIAKLPWGLDVRLRRRRGTPLR